MSLISIHGGGSPQALKAEIHRRYPIDDRKRLVERLIERGLTEGDPTDAAEPGQCCDSGCSGRSTGGP